MSNIRVPGPDKDHPLTELCGGLKPAQDLVRQLFAALLDGLAGKTPDQQELARQLVAIVKDRAEWGYTQMAAGKDFTPEHVARVAAAGTKAGRLGKVEQALRRLDTASDRK